MKCNFCSVPWRCAHCPHNGKRSAERLTVGDFLRAWTLAVWWRFKMHGGK